jgi:protein ImuB
MFAAIVISNFELAAVLRHEPQLRDSPVGLLLEDSKKARLYQITQAAADMAIAPGMTTTQAKARCPKMAFRLRSHAQEAAAGEILLECAYQSAAFIEATEPGVCTLDLRGLAVAKQGQGALQDWAAGALGRLEWFDLPATIGLAGTPALALLAARAARPILVLTQPHAFWRELPIANLAPPPELLEILGKWGIATAADFMALGKDRIAERLGEAGLALFERARADRARPLNLTVPRQDFRERFEFEEPVETLEPLLFVLRRLLDQLCRRLELPGLVMQRLEIALLLDSGARYRCDLEIPAPTREVDALFRIANNHLENVRTDAPVKGLELHSLPAPEEARQFQLFETAIRNPNHFFETIGRIAALLGPDRVGTPRVQLSHRPDDFRMQPIVPDQKIDGTVEQLPPTRGLVLRRFRPPLPATVRLRESQPIFVRCSRLNGAIVQSAGPWRVSGNWWENAWNREEWDVQTKEGGLYRLFLDSAGWFVEGTYD